MADGVYNGMPASELPDLQWRLASGVPGSDGVGVEMARLPDGQIARGHAVREIVRHETFPSDLLEHPGQDLPGPVG